METKKTAVIGIGNKLRKDDGVGLEIAGKIRNLNLSDIRVIESDGDFSRMIEILGEADFLIIADSVSSGGVPGAVYRFDSSGFDNSILIKRNLSSHRYGVVDVLKLAEQIGKIPGKIVIYGVEGADFSFGQELSCRVQEAVAEVVNKIYFDLTGRPVCQKNC